MNQESRQSFFRAEKATIVGHADCWFIRLSRSVPNTPYSILNKYKDESWWVESGNVAVSYSSSYAAIQALQRVRKDLPWTIFESKPQPKHVATESSSSEKQVAHAAQNKIRAAANAHAVKPKQEIGKPSAQGESQNRDNGSQLIKDEMSGERLNEMARAAWALSELGHIPSTPEELNQVLIRLKELREEKK